MAKLSHIDERNQPTMVDVSDKALTVREAVAEALVRMRPATLQMITQGDGQAGQMQLGFPVRGSPRAVGKYKVRVTSSFKCAYIVYEAKTDSLAELWSGFLQDVETAGHELTSERRVMMHVSGGDSIRLELQVGIK